MPSGMSRGGVASLAPPSLQSQMPYPPMDVGGMPPGPGGSSQWPVVPQMVEQVGGCYSREYDSVVVVVLQNYTGTPLRGRQFR